ncbi:MAG: Ig-like domain-containing protein, partial [Halanaerobacter sp.]
MRKSLVIIVVLILSVLLTGCLGEDSSGDDDNDLTISSVKIPREKKLEQGDDYNLPETAEAIMSDNSTKAVKINWSEEVDTSEPREEKEYIGIVEEYSHKVTIKITVVEEQEEAVIESLKIEPQEAVVEVGEDYSLPQVATAEMSDGSEKRLVVTWNKEVDTSEPVVKEEYIGDVEGTDLTVTFELTVEEEAVIESLKIEPQEAVVEVGKDYSLPQIATAGMSDGSEKEVAVMWNKEVDTSKAVEKEEYIGDVEGTDLTVTFALTVIEEQEEPIIESLEIEPQEAVVEVGEDYSLPQIATA